MHLSIIFLACLSLATAVPTARITHGQDAIPHEFPYQVSLQVRGFPYCGGSILNERFILTAALCNAKGEEVEVVAGAHNLAAPDGREQHTRVVKFIPHDDYKPGSLLNDIALVLVDPPLNFTDAVQPVALPQPDQQPLGEAVVSGWGSTSSDEYFARPEVLQKAKVEIYNQAKCKEDFAGWPYDASSNICAASESYQTSVCIGDSGGPLVQRNSRNEVVQQGVVSWIILPCGTYKGPDVYIFVAKYVEWIKGKMAENFA